MSGYVTFEYQAYLKLERVRSEEGGREEDEGELVPVGQRRSLRVLLGDVSAKLHPLVEQELMVAPAGATRTIVIPSAQRQDAIAEEAALQISADAAEDADLQLEIIVLERLLPPRDAEELDAFLSSRIVSVAALLEEEVKRRGPLVVRSTFDSKHANRISEEINLLERLMAAGNAVEGCISSVSITRCSGTYADEESRLEELLGLTSVSSSGSTLFILFVDETLSSWEDHWAVGPLLERGIGQTVDGCSMPEARQPLALDLVVKQDENVEESRSSCRLLLVPGWSDAHCPTVALWSQITEMSQKSGALNICCLENFSGQEPGAGVLEAHYFYLDERNGDVKTRMEEEETEKRELGRCNRSGCIILLHQLLIEAHAHRSINMADDRDEMKVARENIIHEYGNVNVAAAVLCAALTSPLLLPRHSQYKLLYKMLVTQLKRSFGTSC